MKSVRTKVLLVVFVMMAGLALLVAFLSYDTYGKYKKLKIEECRSLIDLSSASVDKSVESLQAGARALALIGFLYSENPQTGFAKRAVVEHFEGVDIAVGGGIWFEPYTVSPHSKRVCYYAFNESGTVRIDEKFQSENYDYLSQSWYVRIKRDALKLNETVWTAPYVDDEGTKALMTTVGAGIFDASGKFIGMSTVDWKLDSIAESFSKIKPTPGSFAMFADTDNDFILALSDASTGENPVGKSLGTVEWYEGSAGNERQMDYGGRRYFSFKRRLANNMVIVINVPRDELFAEIDMYARNMIIGFAISCAVLAAATYILLNRLITRPIAYLSSKAADLGRGDLDTQIEFSANDELGKLARAFDAMKENLKDYISNLNVVTAEKQRIATELDLAHQIQASILPSIFPPYPNREEFDIFASMVPAKEVGGDFFDFFLIDDRHLCIVIADVSDKGVPAALFMMISKTLIKNFAQLKLDAGRIFERANIQLCENNEVNMFVTAFMGILDIETGDFSYVNAGHNPPLLCRNGGEFEWLELPDGLVLGVMDDSAYGVKNLRLQKGDKLYLYTDGVTEAFDPHNELFGEGRLLDCLNANKEYSIEALLGSVAECVNSFADGARQSDDITMLGLLYRGSDG